METIQVRIAEPGGGQVALWERHPAHPGGEVFLAGNGVFEVALTPAVESRLRRGKLIKDAGSVADQLEPGEPKPETPEDAEHRPARAAEKTPPRAKTGPRRGGL